MAASKTKSLATLGVALSALAAADVAEGAVVALTPSAATLANQATVQTLRLTGGSFGVGGTYVGWLVVNSNSVFLIGAGNARLVGATGSASVTAGMAFTSTLSVVPAGTGTRTFGFRNNVSGHLGYFQLQFGPTPSAAKIIGAFHETVAAAAIPIGATPVPEPGTGALFALGTLALGAAGVRKRRKKRLAGKAKTAAA